MNIRLFQEYNRFKKAVASEKKENWQDVVKTFAEVKNAEGMDVSELLKLGKKIVLIGIIDKKQSKRPIVWNYPQDGEGYPAPTGFVMFKQIDLQQDLVELQDTIDIVSDPRSALNFINRPSTALKYLGEETVYGKKGVKSASHLTLAEVVSQLAPRYDQPKIGFYVCDEEESLITGYNAYKVAVYNLTVDVTPEVSIDGLYSI